jgi:hypothetical protein
MTEVNVCVRGHARTAENTVRYRNGQKRCKLCVPILARKWRANNPEQATNNALKATRGITLDEYNRKEAKQGGCCMICGRKSSNGHRLPVDHDHVTGQVRDLLCHRCNRALGSFEDDPALLLKAYEYLVRWKDNFYGTD